VVRLTTFKKAQAIDLYRLFPEWCQKSIPPIGKRCTPPITLLEQVSPFAEAQSALTVWLEIEKSMEVALKIRSRA
jgi:hypothetical protein